MVKRVHIISSGGMWAIKKEGGARAIRKFTNKDLAVSFSKKLHGKGYDIILHRKDGSVDSWTKAT